jgi:hypothetical protein
MCNVKVKDIVAGKKGSDFVVRGTDKSGAAIEVRPSPIMPP